MAQHFGKQFGTGGRTQGSGARLELPGLGIGHQSRTPHSRSGGSDLLCRAGRGDDQATGSRCRWTRWPLPRPPAANTTGRANGPSCHQAGEFPGQQAAGRRHFPAFAVVQTGKTIPLRSQWQRSAVSTIWNVSRLGPPGGDQGGPANARTSPALHE